MFNAVSAVFQPFEEKKIIKRLKLIWFSHLVLDDLLFINQFFFLHFPGKIGTSCPEKGVGENPSLIRRLKSPIQLQITCMFRRRIMIPFGPGYIKQNCV